MNEVSKRLVEELVNHNKTVTVDDLKSFWDKYAIASSAPTQESEKTPPTTEPPMQSVTPESEPESAPSNGEEENNGGDLVIDDGSENENVGDIGGENNGNDNMIDDSFVEENNGYYAVG